MVYLCCSAIQSKFFIVALYRQFLEYKQNITISMAAMTKVERYVNWGITIAVAIAQIVSYAAPILIKALSGN